MRVCSKSECPDGLDAQGANCVSIESTCLLWLVSTVYGESAFFTADKKNALLDAVVEQTLRELGCPRKHQASRPNEFKKVPFEFDGSNTILMAQYATKPTGKKWSIGFGTRNTKSYK